MTPLIKCEHVDFGYDNQDAVVDVNMEVDAGRLPVHCRGKWFRQEHLMKGLLGLLKPTAGRLTVAEELRRTGIGYLPQQTAAPEGFSRHGAGGGFKRRLKPHGTPALLLQGGEGAGGEKYGEAGDHPLKKHCYRELSGGQQQRVLIARALAPPAAS